MADVWYNVGHVGVALGDLGLAYQAFKVGPILLLLTLSSVRRLSCLCALF